jgi:hypothetical protein
LRAQERFNLRELDLACTPRRRNVCLRIAHVVAADTRAALAATDDDVSRCWVTQSPVGFFVPAKRTRRLACTMKNKA